MPSLRSATWKLISRLLEYQETQMRQELGFIYRMERFFAFEFDRDPALHNQVGTKSAIRLYRFIDQRHWLLSLNPKPKVFYLVSEARFMADSRRPGPNLRWILSAAPIISGVRSLEYMQAFLSVLRGSSFANFAVKSFFGRENQEDLNRKGR
jgi:hypothetical protein